MEGIEFLKDNELTISSDIIPFNISYYKTKPELMEIDTYVKFTKGCEKMVRKHPDYDNVISTIREEHMDHCQVLGNITRFDAELELHHGPMLTLFDYCTIVTNYMFAHDIPVNTFSVAKRVIDEHVAGRVQFVVLCKTVHQLIDTGEIFINLNQGIGDIVSFLKLYKDGLDENYIMKINKYIDMSKQFESTDNSILNLETNMVAWKYR